MVDFTEKESENEDNLKTNRANLQFVFPFMLDKDKIDNFIRKLQEENFSFFSLKDLSLENRFYGGNKVSHRSLEQFFLPNIEPILFPEDVKKIEGFRRFTKNLDLPCTFDSNHLHTGFEILSIDIFVCPFHIGIMNIRVELPKDLGYSDVLHFGDVFRVMEPIDEDQDDSKIIHETGEYTKIKDFIFKALCPFMSDYMDHQPNSSYFGSLPFFIDERMYVIGYIEVPENSQISDTDLYRAGQLNGYNVNGKPAVGALNPDYIKRYYKNRVYDRWADQTYYATSDYSFMCVTKATGSLAAHLASEMYGYHYYSLLLYYYYKIVLMKLTHDHSAIDVEKDHSKTELLILMITEFSAKYFFPEVNSRASGKELFHIIKEAFQIDYLFDHIKKTLDSLYQNQENMSSRRNNYLLQILTTYTVISGIYGMNLVIHDWEGKIKWAKIPGYTVFEWISLFTAVSGIIVAAFLGIHALRHWLREKNSFKKKIF
ncbi:hypothetical protein D0469_15940 [Peribacillus saganii]|uniref:Group-specific protein n=1 Tax=Peribacillus saganii TaxID=2303992 RepID=A0A372LL77_9BACI|nr:hypothetical protein [Peribacillus saganii]RFU67111.1 hypothetical protein D0469_15940 [Peribacillus saganii]